MLDKLQKELDQLNRDIAGAYLGDFDCHSISTTDLREMKSRRTYLEARIVELKTAPSSPAK